jgi:uncharacterized protein YcbK (DUF882 family)
MTDIRRRRALLGGLALGGFVLAGQSAALARGALGPRSLAFDNLHTGETLKAVYWENGAYVPQALGAIDHILRDFRTGDVRPIAPPLLDLLANLQSGLGAHGAFGVISGYRSPATNAKLQREGGGGVASHSFHMKGMAIDIRLPGVGLDRLREAARALGRGGVGYYPQSDFVHVDIGPVRHWG